VNSSDSTPSQERIGERPDFREWIDEVMSVLDRRRLDAQPRNGDAKRRGRLARLFLHEGSQTESS
jgi:hypothetical protein